MRNFFAIIIFVFAIHTSARGQDSMQTYKPVPIFKVLYRLDKDFVGSFTYHYGLNYVLAGSLTYGIVKTGVDWKLNRWAYNNKAVANAGMPSVFIGGTIPFLVPLGFYFYGRAHENEQLQLTGLAMGQAAILGISISSGIKVFTGRRAPGILNKDPQKTDYSSDFRFGFLRGGAFHGWPSSHTTVAFAMAVTLSELYPENTGLKIGCLAYASFIGLGVSTNIHWFSDAVAGTFVGYAIGKTVGATYRNLIRDNHKISPYSLYVTPSGMVFLYRF